MSVIPENKVVHNSSSLVQAGCSSRPCMSYIHYSDKRQSIVNLKLVVCQQDSATFAVKAKLCVLTFLLSNILDFSLLFQPLILLQKRYVLVHILDPDPSPLSSIKFHCTCNTYSPAQCMQRPAVVLSAMVCMAVIESNHLELHMAHGKQHFIQIQQQCRICHGLASLIELIVVQYSSSLKL